MKQRQTAFFVYRPRTIRDLFRPHLPDREQDYEIAAIISLNAIDYENFSEDLLVARTFLGTCASLCRRAPILRCLLVRQRGRDGGLLILPEGELVHWAAYLSP